MFKSHNPTLLQILQSGGEVFCNGLFISQGKTEKKISVKKNNIKEEFPLSEDGLKSIFEKYK